MREESNQTLITRETVNRTHKPTPICSTLVATAGLTSGLYLLSTSDFNGTADRVFTGIALIVGAAAMFQASGQWLNKMTHDEGSCVSGSTKDDCTEQPSCSVFLAICSAVGGIGLLATNTLENPVARFFTGLSLYAAGHSSMSFFQGHSKSDMPSERAGCRPEV